MIKINGEIPSDSPIEEKPIYKNWKFWLVIIVIILLATLFLVKKGDFGKTEVPIIEGKEESSVIEDLENLEDFPPLDPSTCEDISNSTEKDRCLQTLR